MNITTELFDILFLLLLLGMMLPFLFTAIPPLMDVGTWGFAVAEDKTMKRIEGNVLSSAELYADDSLSAAELVLTTRVHNRSVTEPSRYRLPNGTVVIVDDGYTVSMDSFTAAAQRVLNPSLRYRLYYNDASDIWEVR